MAVKGNQAKEEVFKIISDAFGDKVVGIFDKKLYVTVMESGSPVQIAISLTCPKNPVGTDTSEQTESLNFADNPTTNAAEYTPAERKNIEELMAALGM